MNCLRQLKRSEERWADKSAKRHKHGYVNHCYVRVYTKGKKSSSLHEVMMCDQCYSFKAVPHEGTWTGLVTETPDETLPVINFEKDNDFIGFKGIRRMYD